MNIGKKSKLFLRRQDFYYEIYNIYRNWNPMMKKAFGVTKAHVKTVLKKYEKYK